MESGRRKPIVLLTPEQEKRFLEECDDWHFPIFLTLILSGLLPDFARRIHYFTRKNQCEFSALSR
jgi:hypothetical protein